MRTSMKLLMLFNAGVSAWNVSEGNYWFATFSALLVLMLCFDEIAYIIRNQEGK